jgi:hypothetical protein
MPWETDDSTGLLGHFIGTITSSIWTTDSTRQDPNKPFLQWDVEVVDVLQENYTGKVPDDLTINVSIGNGWTEDEEGQTVEHKDGLESFKGSTSYGKIISLVAGKVNDYGSNAVPMDGDGKVTADLSGVAKHMQANGFDDPRVASIWTGLTLEFRGIGFKYRGSTDDPFQNILPVGLAGVDDDHKPAAKATKAAAKAAPKEPADTVGVWAGAGADDDTANTLNDLANSAKNHSEFAKNALLLDVVKESDQLRDAVMDSANFPS